MKEQFISLIHKYVLSKPLFAAGTSVGATVAGYLHIISPYIAFVTVIISLIAAVYSLIHNRNLVKEDEKRDKQK